METPKNAEISWVRQRCIGSGSFATVSLAVSKEDGTVFAVKSVGGGGGAAASPSRIESLENEIRILRSLSSPYVVKYLGDDDTWESAPVRNLHLEYLPGGTVADVAKRSGDEVLVRSHARCVAEALRYVHALGIVHCDVKGQNVLVVGHPSSGLAKLADFGSAVEIGSSGRTGKISPRGSPLWMAPEVVRGEYQGPESDVWSLGCTVLEMLTGKPPWEDRGAADTLRRIGYSDELPRIPGHLSDSGRDFLGKCLQRDFRKRWSCDQLLRHPFLSVDLPVESPAFFSSPRRVLDWFDSDTDSESNSASGTVNFSAKERIGRLASGAKWSNWETDGWVAVRREGEGANSEFQNSIRTEGQISPESSDSVGIEEERTSGSEESSCSGVDGDGNINGGVGPSTPRALAVLRPVAGGGGDDNRMYICWKYVVFLLMTFLINVYRCNCMTFILSILLQNYSACSLFRIPVC